MGIRPVRTMKSTSPSPTPARSGQHEETAESGPWQLAQSRR